MESSRDFSRAFVGLNKIVDLGHRLMTGQCALARASTPYNECWDATFLNERLTIWRKTELPRSETGVKYDGASDTLHVVVTPRAVSFEHTKQCTPLSDDDFGGGIMWRLLGGS